jgi:dehydrogenase/reductase SDR family protein 12
MHPGWADTEGVRNRMPVYRAVVRPIIRTPADGADTIVWLGGAPAAAETTGLIWQECERLAGSAA